MFAIYNDKLTKMSLRSENADAFYEEGFEAHLDPESSRYGDKLVLLKRAKVGFQIKFRFYWRNTFHAKPTFYCKDGVRYFHWLCFMSWFDYEYDEVIDKVVKDHLYDFHDKDIVI